MKYTAQQHLEMAKGLTSLASSETDPERKKQYEMQAQDARALAKLAAYRERELYLHPLTPPLASTNPSSPNHIQTVGALIICLLLLIPATALVSIAWRSSSFPMPTADLSEFWLPWPLDALIVQWAGSALLGVCAGALSMAIALGLIRKASSDLVGYAAALVVAILSIALVLQVGFQTGDFAGRGPALMQGLGMAFGIVAVAFDRSRRLR